MKKLNVLIACEYSGIVRDAFTRHGHNATSCDLLPTESNGSHYQGNVLDLIDLDIWDLIVGFPPCTFLCRAQVHRLRSDPARQEKSRLAIEFVKRLYNSKCKRVALENPIGILSTEWQQPNQIVSFHQFGDPYKKDICLWLKGLPLLKPTNIVKPTKTVKNHVNGRMTNEQRSKIKSKFFPGIADAMAAQWGNIIELDPLVAQALSAASSLDQSAGSSGDVSPGLSPGTSLE